MVWGRAVCINHFRRAKQPLNASGALFGSTVVDVEMQGYSGERRKWKIDDAVSKLHLKMCTYGSLLVNRCFANAWREISLVNVG